LHLLALPLDHRQHLRQSVFVFAEKVGSDDGSTPTDASHAVDKHIGLSPGPLNKLEALIEELVDRVLLMVFGRQKEVEGHILSAVSD
jgi:hypothetical protein